jgi:tripartite-type tricarboxylate transporter receptor subunit TctC
MRVEVFSRRSFIVGFAASEFASSLRAQEVYPARAITLIVPFAPGGSTDVIARIVAEAVRFPLGQPVVVDNRAGAGGSVGTAAIARAKPDGYTLGMGTASTLAINPAAYSKLPYDVAADLAPVGAIAEVPNIMSINPAAYSKLPYDVAADLAPVGAIAEVPNIMSINAGLPVNEMAEFIAYAKAGSGKVAYGSAGTGSVSHLMGEQFKLMTGTNLLHVPYRGVGPALNDAVGGQI